MPLSPLRARSSFPTLNPKGNAMTYRGKVKNGVIVLDDKAVLPEGTVVAVEPLPSKSKKTKEDPIYKIGKKARASGIPDLARNLDHYLYGHPKVKDDGK